MEMICQQKYSTSVLDPQDIEGYLSTLPRQFTLNEHMSAAAGKPMIPPDVGPIIGGETLVKPTAVFIFLGHMLWNHSVSTKFLTEKKQIMEIFRKDWRKELEPKKIGVL